jgi:chromate transport protein ChrA
MNITILIIIAMVGEATWETLKMLWEKGKFSIDRLGAIIIAVFLCVAAQADFFQMIGIPLSVPYAGMVLSGLIVSRGANFVHDIFNRVQVKEPQL